MFRLEKIRVGGTRFAVFAALLFSAALSSPGFCGVKTVTIAVVRDGDSAYLDRRIEGVKGELANLAGPDFDLAFKTSPDFNAGWEEDRVAYALSAALSDPSVDLVYAAGLLVSEAAAREETILDKPVVAGVAQDGELLGLSADEKGYSPKRNLSFISIPDNIREDIRAFRKMVGFARMHLLVDAKVFALSENAARIVAGIEKEMGLRVVTVPVGDSPEDALDGLSGAEAVYLTPFFRMGEKEAQALIDGINRLKIPSFSMLGRPAVERGALAGRLPPVESRIRRRIALNIHQILLGESPNRLKVSMALPGRLLLNVDTAQRIGFSAAIATYIGEVEWVGRREVKRGDPITLEEAMRTAAADNVEMAIAADSVASAMGDRDRAKSALYPQLYSRANYRQIDSDRAAASFGSTPEKLTTFGASVRQMLYDDRIVTGYRQATLTYEAERFVKDSVRLDRMADGGTRFLQCLSAMALYRIEKDNLAVTQKNLRLAKVRREVGRAGPEELLRWEAEEAQRKGAVIAVRQSVEVAFVALNQTLGKDMGKRWDPKEITVAADESYFLDNRFHGIVKNMAGVARLAQFSAAEAVANAPEMAGIEKEIEARKLELVRLKRRYYLPTAFAAANYTHRLEESGEGTGLDLGIPIPGLTSPDDHEWSVSLDFTLPLYEGGGRAADIRRALAELRRAQNTKERIRQLIGQRTRTAVFNLSRAWPNIFLSRKGAEKATKNLELVQELYARGRASVTHLIDAQSNSLRQEQNAALTVYRYLGDLVEYQRSIGWFESDKDQKARDDMAGRMAQQMWNAEPQ